MTTLAQRAREFLADKARHKRLGPELVHDMCNSFIDRMRRGSRRHRPVHFNLRSMLRACRAQAALKIRTKSV